MFVPTLYHDNIFDDFDNFFGLSGIEVIGENDDVVPVSRARSCMLITNGKSWAILSESDLDTLFQPPFITLEPSSMFRFPLVPGYYCPHLVVSVPLSASSIRSICAIRRVSRACASTTTTATSKTVAAAFATSSSPSGRTRSDWFPVSPSPHS